jgi:hypothetical protein
VSVVDRAPRRRRRWRRPLSLPLLVVPLLSVVACTAEEPEGTVGQLQKAPTTLLEYLSLPGDQIVVVPNGEYEGGRLSAAHPATDGPYGGWLILVAESQHGVTVRGDLELAEGSSRVLFVGFRFADGRVHNRGEHLAYWYTDHSYPDTDWYAAGRPVPNQFHMFYPGQDISLLGSDLHDTPGSPITLNGVSSIRIEGVKVYSVSEPPGSDPEDRSHLDVIKLVGGATEDLTVRSSYFQGGRLNHQTDHGDVVRVTYQDVWYSAATGSAFQFNATNGGRIVDGTRINVRSWGHVGRSPRDRLDIVEGTSVPVGSRPDRVDVVDDGVETTPPPAGALDPASQWRAEHPYDSWPQYFGWDD